MALVGRLPSLRFAVLLHTLRDTILLFQPERPGRWNEEWLFDPFVLDFVVDLFGDILRIFICAAQFAATTEVSEHSDRLRWPCRTRSVGRLTSWSKADEIVSMKSALSCRSAGLRAARGMIGLVGSRIWSAMYHTNPAYLGFVYWSLSNSTSSGRGVFGSAIFAYGQCVGDGQPTAVCNVQQFVN